MMKNKATKLITLEQIITTAENIVPSIANIFFRPFWISPPIPNPNAARDTNGERQNKLGIESFAIEY
jgi:hypothetical protein